MQNIDVKVASRRFGAPDGWDPAIPCQQVAVIDVGMKVGELDIPMMMTLWKPDDIELEKLKQGGALRLMISGHAFPLLHIDTVSDKDVKEVT